MSLLKKYLSERSKVPPRDGAAAAAGPLQGGAAQEQEQEREQEREQAAATVQVSLNFSSHLKTFTLEDERLPVPFIHISYVPNAITESCGEAIMECVEKGGRQWTPLKTRKLQYFGGLPEKSRTPEELPPWLADISAVLVARGIFPPHLAPNHVLINQYQPGEGIMHHTDGPLYHDCVVILSLDFPAVMSFQPRLTAEQIGASLHKTTYTNTNMLNNDEDESPPTAAACNILLQPNSLLCFSNDAYSEYLHGIDTWDHVLRDSSSNDQSCEDSFATYVLSLSNVIDKKGHDVECNRNRAGSPVAESDKEGLHQHQHKHPRSCVRTSLTIRHMF